MANFFRDFVYHLIGSFSAGVIQNIKGWRFYWSTV